MRSFVEIKSSKIGKTILSFNDIGKSRSCREFERRKYVFNANCENRILAKISAFTVHVCMCLQRRFKLVCASL